MHSSLVMTREGLPLGLAAIKFWNRDKFHGANALKRRINPTRVPIEKKESIRWLENLRQATELLGDPKRCVHIGDRESDIYELFCLAQELDTHFLVRTCVDRLAGEGHDHSCHRNEGLGFARLALAPGAQQAWGAYRLPSSNCASVAWWFVLRSASRSIIRSWS